MKATALFFTLLFTLSFVSSLTADLTCPDEVTVDETFTCELEVSEGSGEYDVKLEIKSGSETTAKILDGDGWKSSYYYLKEYISNEEQKTIEVKIVKEGEYDAMLKLRQGSSTETWDFTISATEKRTEKNSEGTTEEKEHTTTPNSKKQTITTTTNKESPQQTISLNKAPIEEKEKEQATFPYQNYLWKALVLFIIITIIWFLWEKF